MAQNRVKGITIEINGDTTKLQDALKGVNTQLRNTGTALGDVNKLLKLDPGNTTLLKQKQELLTKAIEDTKKKLEQERDALAQVEKSAPRFEAWQTANAPIQAAIDSTNQKLRDLREEATKAKAAMEDGSGSAEQYDKIQAEIKDTEEKLKELREERKRVGDEFGNPISPEKFQALQREIADTEQGLKRLENQLKDFGSVAAEKIAAVGGKMQEVGGKITDAGKAFAPVSAAAGAGLTAAVKIAADFDSEMSKVAAISGAAGGDFDALRDKAREMGAKTKFSATEAAQAMEYMAMAGWKTTDMLGGIEGIMNLAAASGEDLATTSDIVTDALTAFGLKAEDSSHFADILAAASSNANTNVGMMGETFKYVAPVAGALGLSAEDVAEAIGLMANSGIKASQAGTTLRAGLSRLVKPTEDMQSTMLKLGLATSKTYDDIDNSKIEKAAAKVANAELDVKNAQLAYNEAVEKYGESSTKAETALIKLEKKQNDLQTATSALQAAQEGESKTVFDTSLILTDAEGNMRSMDEAINVLREAFSGLSENEQAEAAAILFGQEAMSGWLALINAAPADIDKLSTAIENADGTAQEMADVMQDNLTGQVEILKSQLAELAISIGDTLMPTVRDIVSQIQNVVNWFNQLDDKNKKTIVRIALLVAAVSPFLITLGSVTSAVGNILTLAPKVTGAIGAASKAIGIITPLVKVLFALLLANPIAAGVAAVLALGAAFVSAYKNIKTFHDWVDKIWGKIKSVGGAIVDFVKSIGGRNTSVSENTQAVHKFASGYNQAYILQQPTIFGRGRSGALLMGGDGPGAEAVVGTDLLGRIVRENSGSSAKS